jgi:hypothetical protein
MESGLSEHGFRWMSLIVSLEKKRHFAGNRVVIITSVVISKSDKIWRQRAASMPVEGVAE